MQPLPEPLGQQSFQFWPQTGIKPAIKQWVSEDGSHSNAVTYSQNQIKGFLLILQNHFQSFRDTNKLHTKKTYFFLEQSKDVCEDQVDMVR